MAGLQDFSAEFEGDQIVPSSRPEETPEFRWRFGDESPLNRVPTRVWSDDPLFDFNIPATTLFNATESGSDELLAHQPWAGITPLVGEGDAGLDRFMDTMQPLAITGAAAGRFLQYLGERAQDAVLRPFFLGAEYEKQYGPYPNWPEEAKQEMAGASFNAAGLLGGVGGARALSGHAKNELGIFGGEIGASRDPERAAALARAKEMHQGLQPREDIHNETGFFRDEQGNWRYEIPDDQMRVHSTGAGPLGEMVEHDALMGTYPEMGNAWATLIPQKIPDRIGYYAHGIDPTGLVFRRLHASGDTPEDLRSVAAHELQHGVDSVEGYAPGASPKSDDVRFRVFDDLNHQEDALNEQLDEISIRMSDPNLSNEERGELLRLQRQIWDNRSVLLNRGITPGSLAPEFHDMYRRNLGETMARATQSRLNMTPEERAALPPWESYDVAPELQWWSDRPPAPSHVSGDDIQRIKDDSLGAFGGPKSFDPNEPIPISGLQDQSLPGVSEHNQGRTVYAINSPDPDHLERVKSDMRQMGAPTIEVVNAGDHYIALEGSHRLAAARKLGLTPNLIVRDQSDPIDISRFDWYEPQNWDGTEHAAGDVASWLYDPKQAQPYSFSGIRDPLMEGASMSADEPIRAFHASPHDFDQFSMKHIGSGEGAQAFGQGLYFTANPEVEQHYWNQFRDQFKARNARIPTVNGLPFRSDQARELLGPSYSDVYDAFTRNAGNRSAMLRDYDRKIANYEQALSPNYEDFFRSLPGDQMSEDAIASVTANYRRIAEDNLPALREARAFVANRQNSFSNQIRQPIHYEVDLNVRPDEMLDYDRSFAEQHPGVQEKLRDLGYGARDVDQAEIARLQRAIGEANAKVPDAYATFHDFVGPTADRIMYWRALRDANNAVLDAEANLRRYVNSTAAPSGKQLAPQSLDSADLLREGGIQGLRYNNGMARRRGSGDDPLNKNFVVWNDALIRIMRKYALPMTAAGAAVAQQILADPTQAEAAEMGYRTGRSFADGGLVDGNPYVDDWEAPPSPVHTWDSEMVPSRPGLQAPDEEIPTPLDPIDIFGAEPAEVSGGTPSEWDAYEIKPGDTLWEIARKRYGNALFWKEIAANNGITDPTKLQVGQVLLLPSTSTMGAEAQPMSGADRMARGMPMAPPPRPNPKRMAPLPRPNPIRRADGGRISGLLHSAVPGRTDRLPMQVEADSYVIPADIVSSVGQGNTQAGGPLLDAMFSRYATSGYKDGGAPRNKTDVVVAGGEYVVPPEVVLSLGNGSMEAGHKMLDAMVKKIRTQTVKHLKGLPGPKR